MAKLKTFTVEYQPDPFSSKTRRMKLKAKSGIAAQNMAADRLGLSTKDVFVL